MTKLMPKFQIVVKYWLPPILWALIIFTLSSFTVGGTSQIYWKDFLVKKAAHIFEYGVLAILIYRALINSEMSKKRAVILSIVIASLYGVTDEFHQSFTPGREPRIRDIFIDTIGATLGTTLWSKKY